eukprot:4811032-Ditylum_brightwellii.AAC.1
MFPKFSGLEYATIMQRMGKGYPVLFRMEVRGRLQLGCATFVFQICCMQWDATLSGWNLTCR